jgi:hypothetical protein
MLNHKVKGNRHPQGNTIIKETIQDIKTGHDPTVPLITITIDQIHQETDIAEITTIDHIPHLGITEEIKTLLTKTNQDISLLIEIHTGTIIIIADQRPPIISKEAIVHQMAIKGHIHQTNTQDQIHQMEIIDLIRGTVTGTDHPPLIGKIIHNQMNNQAQLSRE